MYEKMNVPLPDINAYLQRIGIGERGTPTPEFLSKIVFAHQTHIPFEDLDSYHLNEPISLNISDLFDKMVVKPRGGFCFEQNLLFAQALRDLGFKTSTVFCRILCFHENTDLPLCTHCANIVDIDGTKYFCDVGFGGPQPALALPVIMDEPLECPEESWLIVPYDEYWFTLKRKGSLGEWQDILHFNLFPQLPQEFIPACEFCSAPGKSFFSRNLLVGIRTKNGNKNITDGVYTERNNGEVKTVRLENWEETLEVMKREFHIEL